MWLINWDLVLKNLSSGQTEHLKDLASLWVAWCWIKLLLLANFLSQIWQAKGFSPVWVAWCWTNVDFVANFLPQTWQAKRFSPLDFLADIGRPTDYTRQTMRKWNTY